MHSILIRTVLVLNIGLWSQCRSVLEASAKYRFLYITVQPVAVNLEQRGLEQQYTTLQCSINRSRAGTSMTNHTACEKPQSLIRSTTQCGTSTRYLPGSPMDILCDVYLNHCTATNKPVFPVHCCNRIRMANFCRSEIMLPTVV